jgi:hypothetical protein
MVGELTLGQQLIWDLSKLTTREPPRYRLRGPDVEVHAKVLAGGETGAVIAIADVLAGADVLYGLGHEITGLSTNHFINRSSSRLSESARASSTGLRYRS